VKNVTASPRVGVGIGSCTAALLGTANAARFVVDLSIEPRSIITVSAVGLAAAVAGAVLEMRRGASRLVFIAIAAVASLVLPALSPFALPMLVEPVRFLAPVALIVAGWPSWGAERTSDRVVAGVMLAASAGWLVTIVVPVPLVIFLVLQGTALWVGFVDVALPIIRVSAHYLAGALRGDELA
jgi:hypothetical protein